MKSKKGFTLIELLAVIVVLVIISVIAINKITEVMRKNNENTVKANANLFIKNINMNADASRLTNTFKDGIYTVSEVIDMGAKIKGTVPSSGSVVIFGGKVQSACLVYEKYLAKYNDNKVTVEKSDACESLTIAFNFDYSGKEEIFDVPVAGNYKLEVWGAQGGDATSYNGVEVLSGGYGGYSVGKIYLNKGEKLYINVGGTGVDNYLPESGESAVDGGYNGGGSATGSVGSTVVYNVISGSGGGATHIATKSGLLSTLSDSKKSIVIVAGGGGGASSHRYNDSSNIWRGTGGNGGGFQSTAGQEYGRNSTGTPATQTTGGCGYNNSSVYRCGTFGAGANATAGTSCGGGGGGYYGGGVAQHGGTSGGSGYIANPKLSDRIMYCYGCTESNAYNAKTVATTCTSDEPVENCAKIGNGYARITYIDNVVSNDVVEVYYSYGTMNHTIYTENSYGRLCEFKSDRITIPYSGYQTIYTDPVDLSQYNTVIIKKTGNINTGRMYLCANPQCVNCSGPCDSPTFISIGDNIYAADISTKTRTDLKLQVDAYDGANSGDVFYMAFTTKYIDSVTADHSFVPSN